MRARPADRGDQRSRRGGARRPRRAAGRRRLRGLPARPRRGRRHGGGARYARAPAGPAVPRHLRRHAAHGRARPRIRGDGGARLDSRRGRPHHAVRSGSEDSAHGLEHAQRDARRIRCSTASRSGRRGCTPISCTPFTSSRPSAPTWWREADYGGPVTAIVGRDTMVGHAIPSRRRASGSGSS